MTDDRFGDWILTHTGRRFWPLDPRVLDIDVVDIAHALGNLCRWCGHCRDHVSVAQHARYVAETVAVTHPHLQLAALHHDSAEAYLGDIARPLKQALLIDTSMAPSRAIQWLPYPVAAIADVEEHLLRVIFRALSIPWPDSEGWAVIKSADNGVLMTEYRDQMPWDGTAFAGIREKPLTWSFASQTAGYATQSFLTYHTNAVKMRSQTP